MSPATALFPYTTVDKIHESTTHTGSKTLLRVQSAKGSVEWEPFNQEHDRHYQNSRNLYKNTLGNKLRFEEINHDLQLAFEYTWATSEVYGFVRQCKLSNLADRSVRVELVDGLLNILPAGAPRLVQTSRSNLVDAYKWTELDEATGLAMFTLYSGITDRAEPCESLKANVVYCLGLDAPTTLISSSQLVAFRSGLPLQQETHKRGIRGAYFVSQSLELAPQSSRQWQLVANIEQASNPSHKRKRRRANREPVRRAAADLLRVIAKHGHDDDAARQRVVLFGGVRLQDTWEWDGVSWTQATPAQSPSARWAHAMAYDAGRQRIVLFGGLGSGWQSDAWACATGHRWSKR